MRQAIGVDLGGTKIAAGIVDEDGNVLARDVLPSDIADANGVCDQIAQLVRTLAPEGPLAGLGIGAAGIVDHETGRYLYGPNTRLRDVNLADMAAQAVGLDVKLDNDANCAAWAEHRFGAGRGCRDFLCVTLGTGIGGGLVIGNEPYRGAHGGALEIGHMLVDPNGPECGCGSRGCWEQLASGLALERMANEELGAHPQSSLRRTLSEGRVRGPAISAAARGGDDFAQDLVARVATWVGWGLASLVNILEPGRIAVAGGIERDWDLFEGTARDAMVSRVEAADRRPVPDVVPATLGPDAGLVGAALLVFDAS